MKILLAAFGVLLAFASVAGAAAKPGNGRDIVIASGGKSAYAIVVPDKASPVVAYAAKELQHFLREISRAELKIVREREAGSRPAFLLGPCKRSAGLRKSLGDLREDGVLIKALGKDVALLGQNDRGQLYSVYVLLERFLGVKFLAVDCTIIPKKARLTLPAIDYAYSPPFMYRETLYFDSFPKEIATRQRLNGPYAKADAQVGGKIRIFPYVHSFSKLVPPDKYYAEHPEYFSLVEGKRTNLTIHGQLCLTNPDVLKIATAQVLEWIEENPDVPIFDVSQNDGNGACECGKCAAIVKEEGSQHGPIMRFVNAIADEVAKKYPDKWIETLAYAYSTKPSAITKPRKNVIIRLCHAGCYFHGFEECGLGANFATYLNEWSKVTDRIFIWHYATNFAHYISPCQNLSGLVKDIKYYASHNVNGLMVQCNYESSGGELSELRQYLAARLVWDPTLDPKDLIREFCRCYYGAASVDVLTYLALLDKSIADRHAFGAWDPRTTVADTVVFDGLKILRRARLRTLSPEQARRVDKLFLPLWYLQLTFPDSYGLKPAEAPGVLSEFKRVAQENSVQRIREGGVMDQWIKEMEAKYPSAPETSALPEHEQEPPACPELVEWAVPRSAQSARETPACTELVECTVPPAAHSTGSGQAGLACAKSLPESTASSAAKPAGSGSAGDARTILLVDDQDVLYRSGTERVLNPAKRFEGNPVIKQDKPWEAALGWASLYRNPDTGRYQLWYQGYAGSRAQKKSDRCVVCYAESDDGIRFTKPNLGLFPFNDIADTNIVLVANGGHSDRYGNSVIVDPHDKDASRRYKMAYNDFSVDGGKEYPGLAVAFSPDGVHWTKYPEAPLHKTSYGNYENSVPFADETESRPWDNPLTMSDAVDVFYDPVRKSFAGYGKMWIDGPAGGMYWKHAMGRIESKDFIQWGDPELVLTPDDGDPSSVEFHTSPVFYYKDRYFCLNQILNRAVEGGVMDIELMVSPDGYRWDRPFRKTFFIPRNRPGEFDSGSILTSSTPVILDDEIRFYYGGYKGGATGGDDDNMLSGVGFASIPLDRFAGIRPVAKSDQPTLSKPLEHIGQVTLKPVDLGNVRSILLNADASNGTVCVELLDSRGRRVRGFSAADCLPVIGDSLAHPVRWKDASPADLPPGRYMLRLHLDNATVYAVTLA